MTTAILIAFTAVCILVGVRLALAIIWTCEDAGRR